jgi:sugar phosphate isomerase/epimerase
MQYGAMNFPVKPLRDELDTIAALGFDYLELTMDPPAAHYTTVREEKDGLLAALHRYGMRLVCHMPTFVSLADLTESIRKASLTEVLQSIETAALIGADKVVVHPAYIAGMGPHVPELARGFAMESLEVIASRAADLDLTLCLENMFPRTQFCVDVGDLADVFNRLPTLRLTLDTGHANIGSPRGKRTLKLIETFTDRISHVHVSDNFGKEDNHLPIGSGRIKFSKILKALKKTGYNDTVTFEVFTPDREYLRVSRQMFENIWKSA